MANSAEPKRVKELSACIERSKWPLPYSATYSESDDRGEAMLDARRQFVQHFDQRARNCRAGCRAGWSPSARRRCMMPSSSRFAVASAMNFSVSKAGEMAAVSVGDMAKPLPVEDFLERRGG